VEARPLTPTIAEARALQERLRAEVIERDAWAGPVRLVAGADVSYDRGSPLLFAAVVVLDAARLEVVEVATSSAHATFPYVPGYLSFRELPPLLDAFAKLRARPDLVLCDGHGRAHPRRFGFACHLGVALDLPTIGCAKSRLVGEHREPGARRGAHVALRDGAERIGEVLRTRPGVAPVYVSVGHRVSLASACRLVLGFTPRFRVAEPIRAAHAEVNRLRRQGA
jgi:deoxyribonuclease V